MIAVTSNGIMHTTTTTTVRKHFSEPGYPYSCAYLWYMVAVLELSGDEIFDITRSMQEWLYDNVRRDDQNNFKWSSKSTSIIFSANSSTPVFTNYISFKHAEDLLAFRLRWGINI
jgi:hypothetical protein